MKNRFLRGAMAVALCVCMLFTTSCSLLPTGNKQESFDSYIDSLPATMLGPTDMNLNYIVIDKEALGIKDATYELPYSDQKGYESSIKYYKKLAKKLKGYKDSDLREDQVLTKNILIDYAERSIELYQYYYLDNSYLGSYIGFQAQLPLLLHSFNFNTKSDLESYFSLIEQAPETFQKYAQLEKERQENDSGMNQSILNKVIEQCETFASEKRPFLVDSMNERIDTFAFLTDAEKAEAKEKNERLLTTTFIEAYQKLGESLKEIKGREDDLGLSSRKDGRKYYRALLQAKTGTDMTVNEMRGFLTDTMDALITQYQAIAAEHPKEYTQMVSGNAPAYSSLGTSEEVIDYLQKQMLKDYPPVGNLQYTVTKVPDSMKENFSPAAYITAPIDAPEDAPEKIYLNGDYEDSLFTTLAHEGYPGHMYQNAYARSLKLPTVRYLIDYNGYSEGWATYIENNAWQYAEASDSEKISLQLQSINSRITMILICLADIGIHYDGWDRAKFADVMSNYFDLDAEQLNSQYDLILEDPTNYLQYCFNGEFFQNLYDQAEAAAGDKFDPVAFNTVLLSVGTAPCSIIEEQVNRYVEGLTGTSPKIKVTAATAKVVGEATLLRAA